MDRTVHFVGFRDDRYWPASKNPVARALAAKRPAKVRPRKGRRAYARKPRNQEEDACRSR